MGQYVQRMVVWASGKIEFCGDQPEPEGTLTVCVVHGKQAMEQLAELVVDAAEAWYFDDGLALKVPGIDPHREEVPGGIDPAIETLIEWGDQLRNDIGIDPAFVWARG
jgi:hypothetical protein